MQQSKPRIGIIGTGAIGGFYGLMLAKGGHDVHFLLRSEYKDVAEKGITIDSMVHGQLTLNPVQAYRDVADMPACDWLLVGAKSTTNPELAPVIAQAAADGAKVILLQNGLNNEQHLRPLLPDTIHLIGGLCYVCLFREAPGVVKHQANGLIDLGYHSGPADEQGATAIIAEAAELFKSAGIAARTMANVDAARWQKLVWNAAFNGVHVLLNEGTEGLLANPSSRKLISDLMAEVVAAAQACGHEMPADYPEKLLAATRQMPDYYASMYHDWLHKRPMELDSLYGEALRLAAAAGCRMPKTEALLDMLQFIQDGYLAK
ncbi:MAG TPA: putative 2-dehydropantoate 2-reductase [Pseudomonas xinjiangensis]|uniref:2-dehydropantoate 2-reductase n=2 Tax=root TaxID=1 RepID=A0A7V1BQR8_9GAMM|nr:putative 2-dehydropantoate 2-reductase [Halopseudomonas xinjiangensis]HEC48204.1 putative 2-dehydropantoate 2-reductase [Halopseudomonas xinjiangensis]